MISLINGEKMALNNPKTFEVPSSSEKVSISVGDYVKLGFIENGQTERMWVNVTSINGEHTHFEGTLDNEPVLVNMKRTEFVAFNGEHILDIY